jgi:hypothetical protein
MGPLFAAGASINYDEGICPDDRMEIMQEDAKKSPRRRALRAWPVSLHRHYPDQVQRSDPIFVQDPSQPDFSSSRSAFFLKGFMLVRRLLNVFQ